MRKFLSYIFISLCFCLPAFSASMFDDDGYYSGQWKQMTNVNSTGHTKYSSSAYSSSAWYANNNKQRTQNAKASQVAKSSNSMDAVPFRYNTLDYTRIRKVKGGYGDYNARCSDIGDASFCH